MSSVAVAIGITTGTTTIIEKSLAVYRAIAASKNFGSDAAHSVMMLRFEVFRYTNWVRENKLLLDQPASSITTPPQSTPFAAGVVRMSRAQTSAEAIYEALVQVTEVLEAVDKLLGKYHHAFEPRNRAASDAEHDLPAPLLELGGLQNEATKAVTEFRTLKDSLQSKTSLARRVKYGIATWNEPDKETLKSLVTRFQYWNDALLELLPVQRNQLLQTKLSLDVVDEAESVEDLEGIEVAANESSYLSVSKSARTKRRTKFSILASDSALLEKPYADVKIDDGVASSRRFATTYTSSDKESSSSFTPPQHVIVEWYYYDPKWTSAQTSLAHQRVEELSQRFSVLDKPPNLRVLDCLGYICHPSRTDRALFYSIPATQSSTQPISLFKILPLSKKPSEAQPRPTLQERFHLAALLAISFLELHNVSWLHKGFNSNNAIFFPTPAGHINFKEFYLLGFDFSRPDRPGQISLPTRPSPLDLYRHPHLRQPNPGSSNSTPNNTAFKREYDMYSLGLVLFEIGVWMRLEDFMKPGLGPKQFKERIIMYVERDMALLMGEAYANVVKACLSGSYRDGPVDQPVSLDLETGEHNESRDMHVSELSNFASEDRYSTVKSRELSGFYHHVVCQLQRCHCGVDSQF